MEETKKKSKVLNIISNVLFGIVMVLLVVFMIYGFGSISNNKVPSFFGQSYVRILSNSMKASGFERGDIAVIKKVNVSQIQEGDIIAFYYCTLNDSSYDFTESGEIKDFKTGEKSFESQIIFMDWFDIYLYVMALLDINFSPAIFATCSVLSWLLCAISAYFCSRA